MARASAVDPCLICGGLPCECNAKKKAAPRKAAPRKAAHPVNTPQELSKPTVMANPEPASPRQSMLDRMRARAAEAPPTPVVPPPSAPKRARPTAKSAELPELSADELVELRAVRLLNDAFGIHPDDLARWKPYLDRKDTTAERAASWRARRGHVQAKGDAGATD